VTVRDASHPPPAWVGPEVGSASQQVPKGRRLERRGDPARREEHLRTSGEGGGAPAASPESIEGAAGSRSRSARGEMWSGDRDRDAGIELL